MTIPKTVKFQLMTLTESKKNKLQAMADDFKKCYNFASMRFPSFKSVEQSKVRTLLNLIRKDLNGKTSLYSKIVEEAIKYARTNYLTILFQEEHKIPELTKNIIRIHNQVWDFKYKNNRIYVVFPCEKIGSKYSKIWLPIKDSEYYEDIIKSNKKFGVGQIDLDTQTFITTIKQEVVVSDKDYSPETFIGIDLGLNNLATLVILDKNRTILKTNFWNGKEINHIRNKFHKYRKEISKVGRMDKLKASQGYEHRWMRNINHNISKEIINLAKGYPNPIIIMEDLHKFHKLRWNFYQLRQMIEYKAVFNNIQMKLVNPKNTSITCNKCGNITKKNRNGLQFKCLNCKYECHSDFNGAVNIATLGFF